MTEKTNENKAGGVMISATYVCLKLD